MNAAFFSTFPNNANVVQIRRIVDRYIDGTALRLRQQIDRDGAIVFKLTQKIPAPASGSQQGFVTNMYLSEGEFRILAQLAVKQLSKIRYSVPPFGIDLFDGALKGLILAEVEFEPAQDADALTLPSFIGREVSTDNRFSGGQLARASRQDVEAWLSEYGVGLSSS